MAPNEEFVKWSSFDRKALAKWLDFAKQANRKLERKNLGNKADTIELLHSALLNADHFKKDLEELRKKHNIPHLTAATDVRLFTYRGKPGIIKNPSHSLFWEKRGLKKEKVFDADIHRLIDTYEHIPSTFFPWVKHVAMYEGHVGWLPKSSLGVDFLFDILKNPSDLKKLPLTTEERKTLKNITANLLKSTRGRPPKSAGELKVIIRNVLASGGKSPFRRIIFKDRAMKVRARRMQGRKYPDIALSLFTDAGGNDEDEWERDWLKVRDVWTARTRQQDARVKARMRELARKKSKN